MERCRDYVETMPKQNANEIMLFKGPLFIEFWLWRFAESNEHDALMAL